MSGSQGAAQTVGVVANVVQVFTDMRTTREAPDAFDVHGAFAEPCRPLLARQPANEVAAPCAVYRRDGLARLIVGVPRNRAEPGQFLKRFFEAPWSITFPLCGCGR